MDTSLTYFIPRHRIEAASGIMQYRRKRVAATTVVTPRVLHATIGSRSFASAATSVEHSSSFYVQHVRCMSKRTYVRYFAEVRTLCQVIMAALWNRADHYIFAL